ncbi:MAG: hypothetical protein AAF108_09580 [Planctomycetota bacterium]
MLASVSQPIDPEAGLELISGRLATFGLLVGVLIILLAGWAAVFNYLRARHKLRMRDPATPGPRKVDAWTEAGRRFQNNPPDDDASAGPHPNNNPTNDPEDDPEDDDDHDNDDDGDIPVNRPPPTLSPASA